MRLIFKVEDHGVDTRDCFQGAGVANTPFESIATGAGLSARDAGEDALESFYQQIDRDHVRVADLTKLEEEIHSLDPLVDAHTNCAPSCEDCEWQHFVTILWRLEVDPTVDPVYTES